MKTQTIEHLCRRAMEGWVASLPAELQQPAQDDVILTGGNIASLFLGEPVNDWDVYFRTRATAKLVAEHYVGQFVASPPPTLEGNPLLKQVQVVERGDRVAVMVQSAGILTEHSGDGSYHYFEALTDASPEQAEHTAPCHFARSAAAGWNRCTGGQARLPSWRLRPAPPAAVWCGPTTRSASSPRLHRSRG